MVFYPVPCAWADVMLGFSLVLLMMMLLWLSLLEGLQLMGLCSVLYPP